MAADQPAGYFSTFSILDSSRGTNTDDHQHNKAQRRNRKVSVCIPCHRRKLKCDKGQPCSRCSLSGSPEQCVYQEQPSTEPRGDVERNSGSNYRQHLRTRSSSTATLVNEGSERRLQGVTHWRTIASEFTEAWPYISGRVPAWESTYRRIQGHKYLFASLSGLNFPFGGLCSFFQHGDEVIQCLPARPAVNVLIQSYFQTLNPIYRLLHHQQFMKELEEFWNSNSQCSEECWTEHFLDAAQFFFSRSPYLSAPTLVSMRVLCLVIIARMLDLKGAETSQLPVLMGFLSRSAVAIHLHMSPSIHSTLTPFEIEARNRVAMRTGTLCDREDQDAIVPLNINDSQIRYVNHGWSLAQQEAGTGETTDGTFQLKLCEVLPTVAEIINIVNSPTKPPPIWDMIRSFDSRLGQHLQDIELVLPLAYRASGQAPSKTRKMQRDFLRTLVHRTTLALHHHAIALSLGSPQLIASIPVLDKSITNILSIQRDWYSEFDSSRLVGWLLDITGDSLIAAFLYHLNLVRKQQESTPTPSFHERSINPSQNPTIHGTIEIFQSRAGNSAAHYEDFVTVSIAAGCLEALTVGATGEQFLAVLERVAEKVEGVVLGSGEGRDGDGDEEGDEYAISGGG
ncbi:oleate activated transcription factor 3 [Dichotomopilus funicola]|uniref:Oleate activated transcription factor 3 n=1 Tax=Dichotomopilus funicola TaxID=1934379 RepID=A0AAN6VAJ5_9PEZI|nr:oleate activated transcription factor 3 [Dichotomopilus funicola]